MVDICTKRQNGQTVLLQYNSREHRLFIEGREIVSRLHLYYPIHELKIILGNACNFQCKYCQQDKYADTTIRIDYRVFVKKLERYFCEFPLQNIIFYGGEAFLYFEQMVALHRELVKVWPNIQYEVYTNGALFAGDRAEWCMRNDINVRFSYDGPGQFIRGMDPLYVPQVQKAIKQYVRETAPFCATPVITRHNTSYIAYINYLQERLNLAQHQYNILTMAPARAVSKQMLDLLVPEEQLQNFSNNLYAECVSNAHNLSQWGIINTSADLFIRHLGRPLDKKWRCNASNLERVTVDMQGNVVKCPLFTYDSSDADSAESHGIHNIENHHVTDKVPPQFIKWNKWMSDFCANCPVVQMCQADCPYAPNEFFMQNCKRMYHYFIVSFKLAIETITGLSVQSIGFDINQAQQRYLIDKHL